ncbi:hypothetical protein SDC9_205491 [bioreactor metagenome]|uniref:Uncharacterized protein n=1 Tax=bioreactor metagenome TaxID=1076179 RepID=A0A645J319_9ZZZZ
MVLPVFVIEHLAVAGIRRVGHKSGGHVVGEIVPHHALVRHGAVEHPLGFRAHAHQIQLIVLPGLRHKLHQILGLFIEHRAVSPALQAHVADV